MSLRYRHDATPLLDGDIDHHLFDSVPDGSSQHSQHSQQNLPGPSDARFASPPGPNQAEAKRDRRRQQVREAQARFRDRKDRTAEELRARTIVLSDALEKVRAENRVLRARLSRYERVDVASDEVMDAGVPGGAVDGGQHTASWPGASNAPKSERSPGSYRGPQLSGPQHVGWDQPGQSLLSDEPLSLSAAAPMDMGSSPPTTTQPSRQPTSSPYGPAARHGLVSIQQHQPPGRGAPTGENTNNGDDKGRRAEESPVHLSAPGPSVRAFPAPGPDHGRFHAKANMSQPGVWSPVGGFDYPFQDHGAQQGQHGGIWRGGPMAAAAAAAMPGPINQPFGPSGNAPMQMQPAHDGRSGQSPHHVQGRRQQGDGMMGPPQYQGDSTKAEFAQGRDDRIQGPMDTVSRWHSTMPPAHMLEGQPWTPMPQPDHQQQPPPHQRSDGRMMSGMPGSGPGPGQGRMTDGK